MWPLTWLKGEDPGNTVKLFDEQQAIAEGRKCTQWFYEDRISDLWKKLNPVVHQELGSEAGLSELRQHVLQQMGTEGRVYEESVKVEGALRVYRRLAKSGKDSTATEVTMGFDPTGLVAQFRIRPASVP